MKIDTFIYKIKKIIEYIPVLWEDEDWDYCYILRLLIYKLKRTKECIIKNNIIVDEEIEIIKNQIDETLQHYNNYINADKIYEKEHPFKFKVDCEFDRTSGPTSIKWVEDLSRERLSNAEQSEYKEYLYKQSEYEKSELHTMFDSIKNNICNWWD